MCALNKKGSVFYELFRVFFELVREFFELVSVFYEPLTVVNEYNIVGVFIEPVSECLNQLVYLMN